MPPGRTKTVELVKLLNGTDQPIYLLDEDRTLVFCNHACLDWVGQTADELLGRCCAFHSDPITTSLDATIADLCPPPVALAGEETPGILAVGMPKGGVSRRQAHFLPLKSSAGKLRGVLVVVESQDLSEPAFAAASSAESESAWLHERLRAFHRQAASRLSADRLVGDSLAMRRVRSQVAVASQTKASVLLLGPSGSGRQRVAGAIHYHGEPSTAGALVPLACSVLNADLIHSTIQALARKSPSGENRAQDTLLLNDVDCLPSENQGPLVELFSGKSWPMRLIATARQPLEELARHGKYRLDLAIMLSTIVVHLPPLAERREDIPLLAQMFLEQCNAKGAKQLVGFASEALDHLDAYPWPGNADELAQVVAETHTRAESVEIGVDDLPQRIHLAAAASAHPRRVDETIVLEEYLGRIERELIQRALTRAKGNKTKAAKLLGMTRPRLYRRLVQLGLEEGADGSGHDLPHA